MLGDFSALTKYLQGFLSKCKKVRVLSDNSRRHTTLRVLLASIFALSIALSVTSPLQLWDRRLYLNIDNSLGNVLSVLLWLIAVALAAALFARKRDRIGWLSVAILTLAIAIVEIRDFKDEISAWLVSDAGSETWILIFAPVVLPLLIVASRTLWSGTRSATQRALLIATGLFAAITLVLDNIILPLGVAEEGSEIMSSVMLIAVLLSILGWVPLAPTFFTWRFMAIITLLTVLPAGILDAREYRIRVAGGIEDKPEIHHGPLSLVSQTLTVDRDHLSRIDVWAESTGESAELILRLGSPGRPPIRESRTVTSHPRWSNRTVTFDFAPIPDSEGQTYEISVGALQPEPYVFVGLSTDDPIPESVVLVNHGADSSSSDLALRVYTPGRGLRWLATMLQDRARTDVLISVEFFVVWLWVVVAILWLTASSFNVSKREQESEWIARN